MYDQGVDVLRVFDRDTPGNRASLAKACENVVRMEELERQLTEQQALVSDAKRYTGKTYQDVQRLSKELYKHHQIFRRDAYEYGWSPRARALLIEKYRRMKSSEQDNIPEDDPLERFLRTYSMMPLAQPNPSEPDPLELMLNHEW